MSRPKEIRNFIIAIVIIVAIFACGVMYLKAQADHQNLLASVVNVVPTGTSSAPAAATAIVTSTASTSIIAPTSTPTSSIINKPVTTPAPKPIHASTPVIQPVPTVTVTKPAPAPSTPTSTPAPAPTPAPTPAPAPAPKPATPPGSPAISFPFNEVNFSNDTNWKRTWGALAIDDSGALDLTATATTNGGTVYLGNVNNLANWQDYTFTATFDWDSGEQIDLLSRYVDANNYVVCEFDEEFLGTVHITLRQHLNGKTYQLATGDVLNFDQYGGTDLSASIETNGTQATCTFENHSISNDGTGTTLNPPYTGTVGFSTWDGDRDNTQLVIKSVSVKKNY